MRDDVTAVSSVWRTQDLIYDAVNSSEQKEIQQNQYTQVEEHIAIPCFESIR